MSKPKKYTLDALVDDDGVAQSQTPGAAGNLTINGALASGGAVSLASAHIVEIVCGGADSARTFIVYGTDDTGTAITDTIAGVGTSTAIGVKYFRTITRVAVDAATAGTIKVGFNGKAATPWFPCNYRSDGFTLRFGAIVTGTINYTVQHTLSNLSNIAYAALVALPHGSIASKTATDTGEYLSAISAVRCIANSGSGALDFQVVESGK